MSVPVWSGLLQPLILVLVGWGLGILSDPLLSTIRRKSQRRTLGSVLDEELSSLRFRLAFVVLMMEMRAGRVNSGLLRWVKSINDSTPGRRDLDDAEKQLQTALDSYLKLPDEALNALNQKNIQQTATEGGIKFVKPFDLPFLDSRVSELGVFSEEKQRALIEVRAQLSFLNEEIRWLHELTALSFDQSITGANRQALDDNIERAHNNISQKAKVVAKSIDSQSGMR